MTKRYAVHNLRCAGCAARIEDAIAGLPGVKSAAITSTAPGCASKANSPNSRR